MKTTSDDFIRCRAISKSTGTQCRHAAMRGSDYCPTHRAKMRKRPVRNKTASAAQDTSRAASGNAPRNAVQNAPRVESETPVATASARAAGGMYPARGARAITTRIMEMRDDPDLLTLRTEVATLKAMLEDALGRLDEARMSDDAESAVPAAEKRVESLTMSILSAGEKFTRVEERRRGVLTASEIGVIVDRIKERVIDVVRKADEDDSPEETARRIAEAFSAIEIVGSGD